MLGGSLKSACQVWDTRNDTYGQRGSRGDQFVGKKFTALFKKAKVRISIGERGFRDNLVMERFWKSYKWEFLYLKDRPGLKELREVTRQWVKYYNGEKPHQSLGYLTPDEVYYGRRGKLAA